MGQRLHLLAQLACVAAALCACAGEAPQQRTAAQAVIYGDDDRVELGQVADAEGLLGSVVVIVPDDRVGPAGLDPTTLAQRQGVCDDAPFAAQPAPARCTGVLIDDDLVLTAGHCVRSEAECVGQRVVRGWAVDGQGRAPGAESLDVARCRRVAVQAGRVDGDDVVDVAVIQLDAPLSGGVPATLALSRPATGDALRLVSSTSGVPLKADDGGEVQRVLDASLLVTADAFGGSSGGPLFDRSGALAAVLVQGDEDWVWRDTCYEPAQADGDGEVATLAGEAVLALCARGWPSERLCGIGARCGDGVCSADEDCADDCARVVAFCGDGVCADDERDACDLDCSAPEPPPAGWTCAPRRYAAADGCDCACGAPDPDCAPDALVYGCERGELCDEGGACIDPRAGVPDAWRCDPAWYGMADGCDCRCGAWDPDCDDPAQQVLRCEAGETCIEPGECAADGVDEVPAEWTCNRTWYAASDDCDCDCGAWDPDCANPSLTVLGCAEGQVCAGPGMCEDPPVMVPPIGHGCATGRGGGRSALLALLALCVGRRRPVARARDVS